VPYKKNDDYFEGFEWSENFIKEPESIEELTEWLKVFKQTCVMPNYDKD
jgi:hypothetical protein